MKRYLILATAGLLALASCHKTNKVNDPQVPGDWKFVRMDWSAAAISQFLPGKDTTIVLHLQADHTYSITVNGHVLSGGTFEETTVQYDNRGTTFPALFFSNVPQLGTYLFIPQKSTYTLSGNNLSMQPYFLTPAGLGTYIFARDHS